jgi:hypothetical protein
MQWNSVCKVTAFYSYFPFISSIFPFFFLPFTPLFHSSNSTRIVLKLAPVKCNMAGSVGHKQDTPSTEIANYCQLRVYGLHWRFHNLRREQQAYIR